MKKNTPFTDNNMHAAVLHPTSRSLDAMADVLKPAGARDYENAFRISADLSCDRCIACTHYTKKGEGYGYCDQFASHSYSNQTCGYYKHRMGSNGI